MKIKFSHVLLYNFINAEKKSMLSKWSHCDDQVKVQSSARIKIWFLANLGLVRSSESDGQKLSSS